MIKLEPWLEREKASMKRKSLFSCCLIYVVSRSVETVLADVSS